MDNSLPSSEPHTAAERLMERTIFASRWLLAPFYVGLAVSLVVLLIKFGQKTVELLADALPSSSGDVITNVLSLIDLSLRQSRADGDVGLLREFRLSFRIGRSQVQAAIDGSCRLWRPQGQIADVDRLPSRLFTCWRVS